MGKIDDDAIKTNPTEVSEGGVKASQVRDYYETTEGGVSYEQVAEHFNIRLYDVRKVLDPDFAPDPNIEDAS